MKKEIPDLRNTHEITLEHCYVILERVDKALSEIDGQHGMTSGIDGDFLKDVFEQYLTPEAFSHLFNSEFGKNILAGMFIQKLLEQVYFDGEEE